MAAINFGAFLISASLALAASAGAAPPFSHRLHLEQAHAKCLDCHAAAAQSTSSSDNLLPLEKTCLKCHRDTAAIRAALSRPEPQPKRNFRFSHKQHLDFGDLGPAIADAIEKGQYLSPARPAVADLKTGNVCAACHRGVNRVDVATAANLPRMADCLTCHNTIDPPDSCQFCHTKDAVLKPVSHTPDFIDAHTNKKFDKASCAVCHGVRFTCMGCH